MIKKKCELLRAKKLRYKGYIDRIDKLIEQLQKRCSHLNGKRENDRCPISPSEYFHCPDCGYYKLYW